MGAVGRWSGGVAGDGGDGGGDSGAEAEPPSPWGYGRDCMFKSHLMNFFIHVKKVIESLFLVPLPSGNYIYYRVRFIFYIRKFRLSDGLHFANETAIVGPSKWGIDMA